ncbi:hypothetical protein D9M69_561500 [compost metagenome]
MGEVDIDRVQLLDARQQGDIALPHQRSLGHQRTADTSGNRRTHRGITQVQAGAFQVGLSCAGRRLGAAQIGHGAVEVLLAHRLDLHQRRVPFYPRLGFEQRGLGPSQFTFSTRDCRLERRRIDQEQQVAGLHIRAFLEALRQHDAGDPRANFGNPHRFDPPRQLRLQHQRLGHRRRHRDRTRHLDGNFRCIRLATTDQCD